MQTDRIQKQKISSYFQSVPKRSLSYNDLKKKRLLRSQKSKTKLKPDNSERLIVRTQKKKVSQQFSIGISTTSNTPNDMKKIEKSIHDLKDVFDDMKQKSKIKKYMISKPFYTDRIVDSKKISFIDKSTKNEKINALYESVDLAGNQKELIKRIIEKKKSQRRLLKFDEIRAEVKKSKSKSKLKILEDDTAANSNFVNSLSQQKLDQSRSKKNLRINKFETVKQKPLTISVTQRPSNTEAVQKYPTVEIMNKESLGIKSQYRSRRKLRIDDFKTQRREIQNRESGDSEFKVKFHRKLRKTNSQIVIKTKQLMYDKSKYQSKMQHKSIIIKSAEKQLFSNQKKQQLEQRSKQERKQNNFIVDSQNQKKDKQSKRQSQFQSKNELKDLQFSAINISQIQLRKEQSLNDIEHQLDILQVIEAQELQMEMKKVKPFQCQLQSHKFKKPLKSTNKKYQLNSCQIQNAQNIENLSNILDFISLPTKQLKVKINRCSTKIGKKKNQLEKFKKIFPMNFFNN